MSAAHTIDAGVQMSLRIGQRVRHRDYKGQRVTGVVRELSVDSEQVLMVSIVLDAPIVIPAGHGHAAISLHTQHAPAHEFSPFDERDELMAELLDIAQRVEALLTRQRWLEGATSPEASLLRDARAAIAKATGTAT